MSKHPKKRNKPYRGADAASVPRVTRYSVGNESKLTSWWKENKRVSLFRLAAVGLATLLGWLAYTIVY